MYESATDGVLVADISIMAPMMKAGSSVVVDFGQGETNLYSHVGIGQGYTFGASAAAGIVENYKDAQS